jgi:cytochrome c peroxidase
MHASLVTHLGLAALLLSVAPAAPAQDIDREALHDTASGLFSPLPETFESDDNPLNDAKVELGKMLFYDPRLSQSGFISCNSCHNMATYGVDNLATSLGHDWAVGPRNAPTVLNAALHSSQFWDGRAEDVEEQAALSSTRSRWPSPARKSPSNASARCPNTSIDSSRPFPMRNRR